MELIDKCADRFQGISKVRILLPAKQRSSNYLEPSKENVWGEYDAATLTMLYLKVLHDMVSPNYQIVFSNAAICTRNICTEH